MLQCIIQTVSLCKSLRLGVTGRVCTGIVERDADPPPHPHTLFRSSLIHFKNLSSLGFGPCSFTAWLCNIE